MGGQLSDFYYSSMYDFVLMLGGYKKRNGIDQDNDITTTEDLDDLYSRIQLPEE